MFMQSFISSFHISHIQTNGQQYYSDEDKMKIMFPAEYTDTLQKARQSQYQKGIPMVDEESRNKIYICGKKCLKSSGIKQT